MANYMVILFLAMIVLAMAKALPDYEQDGQEILNGADTRYYGLPFWFRRPLTGDDSDDYGANDGGYERPENHRYKNAVPSYAIAGAGWGR